MEKIIEDWKKNALKDEEENFLYIRSLKMKSENKVDKVAKELHKEAFEKIDCLKCGNCCKTTYTVFPEEDIEKISTHLNISISDFKDRYVELDENGDWVSNSLPCPFLAENNECKIYEVRPRDCREFPHTHKSGFASRSYMHSSNTVVCPAAYYIVKELQKVFR